MAETRLMIPSGPLTLESCYAGGQGRDACVVLHPHPLYGGDMDNNVVKVVQRTLSAEGWDTLRYNSRGVGASGGHYDNGAGESEDLIHVAGHLKTLVPDARLHVAAYSFGVWVALKSMLEHGWSPASLFLVSPPLDFVSFDGLSLPPVPCLVAVGDRDEFCSIPNLRDWLHAPGNSSEQVDLKIVPRCDHFFWDFEDELSQIVSEFARKLHASPR